MRGNHWLIGFSVLILLALISCAQPVLASGPNPASDTDPPRDWGRDVGNVIGATTNFFEAIGGLVVQVGQVSRCALGLLTCLSLPLAYLGLWTLSKLDRILGLMALQDNVHSFFSRSREEAK